MAAPATNIVEALRASATAAPERPAVCCADRQLTYGDLLDRAGRLAAGLRAQGIGPGRAVTLYSPNCAEWVVSYYGILMSGAVANPINALLTAEEVAYVTQDCGAELMLGAQDRLAPLHPLTAGGGLRQLIGYGAGPGDGSSPFEELLAAQPAPLAPEVLDSGATSTICYTSGTTGYPKGAMHSHHNVLMNARLTALMHQRRASDVVVTALPLTHVYGTVVMNSTLGSGGTLVLLPRFEEQAALSAIETRRATLFEGVPTMYFYLLNHPDLGRYDLSSLRACTVGGQTMPVAKMEEVERRFGCPLVELWGMTELAGLGTTFAAEGPVRHGSIGVPLPYCQARIADLENPERSLPPGEAGELMFRGPVVMQGYFGKEEATRETILPDGWLRTGDVARMDEDGFIFVVDRKKDMILTAGYNVYPAEIERVLAGHPDVAMVAVGAIPDENKGELAKAYIVPRTGRQPAEADIIAYAREHLAAYKIPRAVQFVADFPRTSSGKIMRRRLHELDTGT